jgi:hypothetical protein
MPATTRTNNTHADQWARRRHGVAGVVGVFASSGSGCIDSTGEGLAGVAAVGSGVARAHHSCRQRPQRTRRPATPTASASTWNREPQFEHCRIINFFSEI